jgi:RimJ/RimL family protein N-acetyltransferase
MLDQSFVGEIAAFADAESPERGRLLFEQFFRDGARCAGVHHDGRLVACCWSFSGRFVARFDDVHSVTLTLADNEIVFGHGLIDEAYRLKGLFPQLLGMLVDDAPAGAAIFATVDALNERSWVSHQRLGFVPEASLKYFALGGIERVAFRGYGARTWHRGLLAMPVALLRAHAPRSRFLTMPIVATPLAHAVKGFFDTAASVPFAQSVNWLSAFAADTRGRLFVTLDGDRAVACSVVTEQPMSWLRKSVYRIQQGPLCRDQANLRQHLADLVDATQPNGIAVEISPATLAPRDAVASVLQDAGFVAARQARGAASTLIVSLERNIEDLFAAVSPAAREAIRSAAEAGVAVTDSPSKAQVETLLQLDASAHCSAVWGVTADALRRLAAGDAPASSLRAFVATQSGEVIGGAIGFVHKERLSLLPVIARSGRGRQGELATAIEWQVIAAAKASGLRGCDLLRRRQPVRVFGPQVEQRVPLHVRIASPLLARTVALAGRLRRRRDVADTRVQLWSEPAHSTVNER